MNFGEAIASGFSNYVNFSSRAARSEYWYWVLFNVLAQVVTEIIDNAVIGMSVTTAIFSLAVLLPGIAVAARRLHDVDRTGWWLLLAFVPRRRPHRAADLVLHRRHGRPTGSAPIRCQAEGNVDPRPAV